jgi:hypothetical protein
MLIEFTLRRTTIESLLQKAGPVRIDLGKGKHRRWVELGPPDDVVLVPGRGARISTTGHVHYAVGDFEPRVDIRRLELLVEPKLVHSPDGMRLVMGLDLIGLDLDRIPAFFDGRISALVNAALEPARERMMWNLGVGFTRSVPLPAQIDSIESIDLEPVDAELRISTNMIVLRIALDPGITRHDLGMIEAAMEPLS